MGATVPLLLLLVPDRVDRSPLAITQPHAGLSGYLFEREAYQHERDLNYLAHRRHYSFLSYLF